MIQLLKKYLKLYLVFLPFIQTAGTMSLLDEPQHGRMFVPQE